MAKKLPGVLMFLLVILGSAEDDCSSSCSSTSCTCPYHRLTSVPQDLPTTITDLDLQRNQITTLSQSDFSRYRNLETLELTLNDISTINYGAFYHLSNLTTLSLLLNQLKNLTAHMFTGLGNLQELILDYNYDISDIQAGTFSSTPKLRRLYLGGTALTTLRSDMFIGLANLHTLHPRYSDITDIQAGTFSPIPQLRSLWLEYDKLTILTAGMFTGLGNLPELRLNGNDITDIQGGTFSSTPQLRTLVLFWNKLTILRPDMFTGLGNLLRLELEGNEIRDIQTGTFDSTPQLAFLYLQNNRFQTIPRNSLVPLSNLHTLNLSGNNITMFPIEDLSRLQRLSRLYLQDNQMAILPSTVYDLLTSISDVNIGNNPWQCDCRMLSFRLQMSGLYPFENQINCSLPDDLNGQRLIDIHPEDLMSNCEDPTIVRFERGGNTISVQDETFQLVCEASGIPTPDITVILPSGLNVTFESVGRVVGQINGTVMITNVTAADAGLYVCIAGSTVGSTFATMSVNLAYQKPAIVRLESIVNPLVQGEILHLVCEASGIPTPDITVILPSGLNVTVAPERKGNSSFAITNVTAADAGLYVCIAVNAAGSSFATLVVDPQAAPTTVSIPSVTAPLATTSNSPESSTDLDSSMTSFSPPVSAFSSHSKLPEPAPTFSLSVLLGAICGSIAGTVIIGGIILTIWCKRNNKSPQKGPDFSVVFNNTNTTTTVITNTQTGHPQAMNESLNVRNPQHVPRPASSQFEPYEDVEPPPSNPRLRSPRQPTLRQALRPPNRSNTPNDDLPPLPPPRVASASGTEDSLHHYQPLSNTRIEQSNGNGTPHHYQSLSNTRNEENSNSDAPHHYQSLSNTGNVQNNSLDNPHHYQSLRKT